MEKYTLCTIDTFRNKPQESSRKSTGQETTANQVGNLAISCGGGNGEAESLISVAIDMCVSCFSRNFTVFSEVFSNVDIFLVKHQ